MPLAFAVPFCLFGYDTSAPLSDSFIIVLISQAPKTTEQFKKNQEYENCFTHGLLSPLWPGQASSMAPAPFQYELDSVA